MSAKIVFFGVVLDFHFSFLFFVFVFVLFCFVLFCFVLFCFVLFCYIYLFIFQAQPAILLIDHIEV